MSTKSEAVLSVLTDEPQGRQAIADALGMEAQGVSAELTGLAHKGLAVRGAGGWILGTGTPAKAKRHEAPAAEEAKPTKRRVKRRQAKSLPPPAASMPTANGRACEFAIAESGAILFKITAGPRTGELGEIGCADAMALYRLMSAVEFIVENA
jgi:hypothetical protein